MIICIYSVTYTLFCHLKPRYVKCAGDHSTSHCPRKKRSSDVQCVFCNGNHPANYKGCTVYKDLQKKPIHPLRPKQYTPPEPLRQTLHTQPGITYAQITKPNTCTPTPQDTDHLPTQSQQPSGENHNLKFLMKTLFDQLSATINLLNTVISKLP
jgi:hypothetical protein